MPNQIANDMVETIHDLEERLEVELNHSHCLEIELAEIKRLKPVNISKEEYMVQGYLTKEKYYTCPKCNKTLGNVRLVDIMAIGREYKYCNRCGQGLDWSEATKQNPVFIGGE